MFRKKAHKKKGFNPIIGIFRLFLSLMIFAMLLGGIYSAVKSFSGVDPLNLSPQSISQKYFSKDALINLALGFLTVDFKQKAIELTEGQTSKIIPADKPQPTSNPKSAILFKFALIADSENDNADLAKALAQAKSDGAQFMIGLGDYSDVGTIAEFQNAKLKLDQNGLRYFLTPGDHDLWNSRDKSKPAETDFSGVFGPTYQTFQYEDVGFIILANADNYDGFGNDQLGWLTNQITLMKADNPKLILAFMHEPLYHPTSDHFMGRVTPSLVAEAKTVTKQLKAAGVAEAFAGDVHYFTQYNEPETGLKMTTIGAITSERSIEPPRFGMVTVFKDYSYRVEDVEVK